MRTDCFALTKFSLDGNFSSLFYRYSGVSLIERMLLRCRKIVKLSCYFTRKNILLKSSLNHAVVKLSCSN